MGRIYSLIIISILLVVFDVYIYNAISSIFPNWSTQKKKRFRNIWWGYTIVLLIGVLISIFFNIKLGIRSVTLVAFFLTFVSKFFFIPILLIDDFRRLIIWFKRKSNKKEVAVENTQSESNISRSEFLVKTGMAVAAIPFGTLSWGIVSGAHDYRIKRQTLILPNLPKAFDGIKIAQLSDIHSGSFYNKKAVLGGVEMLLNEKPDIAFFTGDLVNGKASELRDYQDIFSKVKAPLGVFSCLGNHDYGMYEKWPSQAAQDKNHQDIIKTHKNMGWDLLINEHRSIKVDNEEIGILGIENWGAGRFPKFGKMEEAVKNTDDLAVKLLLSHDPSHWKAQVLKDYPQIDVMFSGHTHGSQFGIDTGDFQWSPVQYIYEQWKGLYQENNQQLYVNVGFGFIGYPGRVGMLPEITIFELKSA
ncbi:putative metallophosphoesterase [Pedobacter glucosidilyticus]|nr:metallophosphoesterase [Pedobacter glucosidilyticus]KHJ38623.1 putative metallophosphoesterase [Pedobacter glucosidilyticus]